jgi:glycosyltransferase involved in cell wall biosynthesis
LLIVENLTVPFDRRVWMEAVSLTEAGYQVSIICPTGGEYSRAYEQIEGITIYRYRSPRPTRGHMSYFWEFFYCWAMTAFLSLRVLRREGFDIIHACNPPDTFFLLGMLYKPFGKRFVYDQHDLCPEVYLARFKRKPNLLYRGLLVLERLTYATADLVLSPNESYREMAIKRGNVPPERVMVVRSAPDPRRFQSVPPDIALKRGRRFLVVYLGVMAPQDGVDLLIDVVDYLVHQRGRRDVTFALIGSGDSYYDLRKLASERGLDDYVTFTGRIPDEEVERYISSSDVCVSPDPKNELNDHSTMNKVLEYMALAKPSVAFDLKETRFSAGPSALYALPNDPADFGERVLELLADEPLRREMGALGLERLRAHLGWAHSRRALLRAYAGLAGLRARARAIPGSLRPAAGVAPAAGAPAGSAPPAAGGWG